MSNLPTFVRLTPTQVNKALEFCVVAAIISGLASWSVSDTWSGLLTFIHGACGIMVAIMVPAKLRGSVRTGFKRGRTTRWLSALFGVLVLVTLTLGFLHATGIWFGVGQWSALWTHELVGFATIPLLIWHVASRPVASARSSLSRRTFLRFGGIAAAAAVLHVGQRTTAGLVDLAGGERRSTGSHEVGSFSPALLPTVVWINDRRPASTDADDWNLQVDGQTVSIEALRGQARSVVATLDCTGGWWSQQSWDAVPLSELIAEPSGRSVYIESSTGYGRHFPLRELANLYLAVGYGGEALRAGHGAPVRLVVPGRRGPEWIKWVTLVTCSERHALLQPPLPLS